MKRKIEIFLIIFLMIGLVRLFAQSPKVYWDFEKIQKGKVLEVINGKWDLLEGNYAEATGMVGKGLRLDGFTTCLKGNETKTAKVGQELTVELWLAIGEYPWNWCPALTTEEGDTSGYRLTIGPYGQVAMEACIDEQWKSCTTERGSLPLRKWTQLVGIYKANQMIELYIDGERRAFSEIKGELKPIAGNFLIGMVASPRKPSDIHRTFGTLKDYYGLEGIIDEIKIYDVALSPDRIKSNYLQNKIIQPEIKPRRLPTVEKNPQKFGAFYTKLKYYSGWDNLWPVGEDPDVVITFGNSLVKMVFWRGTRYSPVWVSENELWMADQSVEAWNDQEGCFEHMQDRHCRFSHVRIIENNPARVVVHWRYAPVSVNENTWKRDPKTGWECWVDEYYYIYPDRTATRKVSWKKGTLEFPRQFQESEVLLQPEQRVCDVVEKDFASVADYNGRVKKVSFVEDPNKPPFGPFNWSKTYDYTVQQFNFRAKNKPFICFEPDNKMWIRYESLKSYELATGCNHWPVGQARCDGRTTVVADRPSHTIGFPISEPVVHESDDREFWFALYGMNEMEIESLTEFGRSWAYPANLVINSAGFRSYGYDKSERCYKIENLKGSADTLVMNLKGSKNSPVFNPTFQVKNWGGNGAKVYVDNKEANESCVGINRTLTGSDLVIFLPVKAASNLEIKIIPL